MFSKILLISLCGFILPTGVMAENVEGYIGVYSQYIFRGGQESPNAIVQSELEAELGAGFAASLSIVSPKGNNFQGGSLTEIESEITYGIELADLKLKLGLMHTTILNNASANVLESVVVMEYKPVLLHYYYAFSGNGNSRKKDQYASMLLSGSITSIDLSSNFGFYFPSKDAANPTKFPTRKNELAHIDLKASKSFKLGDVHLSPSVLLSIPTYTGRPKNANQLVLGMSVAF